MSSDNEATIKIVGDASGVAPAVDKAKLGIEGLVAMSKAASELMVTSFKGVAKQIEQIAKPMTEVSEAIQGMKKVLSEFSEAMLAAFMVEKIADWARELGEAAEKTQHLAQTFGMSVPQVQGLDAAAKMTGMSMDELARAMGIFDKNLAMAANGTGPAAQAFKALGVSAKDGKTQMQLLLDVADKFKGYADGPAKVALAMVLFGRAGAQMIPFLDRGKEGIKELEATMESFSAGTLEATAANKDLQTWLDQTNARGMALAESTNTTGVAMQGVANVMTSAFATSLKVATDGINELIQGFIDSYRNGGLVADVLDFLAGAVEVVAEVLRSLGEIIGALWSSATEIFKDIAEVFGATIGDSIPSNVLTVRKAFNALIDIIVAAKDYLLIFVYETLGPIERWAKTIVVAFEAAMKAVHGDWAGAEAAWDKGTKDIGDMAVQQAARVKAAWQDAMRAMTAFTEGRDVNDPKGENGGGSKKAPAPGIAKPGKVKKEKAPKDDLVQQWKAELADMLADTTRFGQDDVTVALQFWNERLAGLKKGSKDELEVRREVSRLKLELLKREQSDDISAIKARQSILADQAKTEVALAKIAVQEKLDLIASEEKNGEITAAKAVQARADLNRQIYQLDLDEAKREYDIKVQALKDEEALQGTTPERKRAIDQQLLVLEKQYQDRRAVLSAQADQTIRKDNLDVITAQMANFRAMQKGFADAIGKMVSLQQGFAATLKNLWQNLQNAIASAVSQMVSTWLAGLAAKEAAETASHTKSILKTAKDAAAGAWAAVVKIPVVGPMLAPVAAAASFAGVMAFSAKDGWDVPNIGGAGIDGMGGIPGIVHPGEMILPSDIAGPLRGMISNYRDAMPSITGWDLPDNPRSWFQPPDGRAPSSVATGASGGGDTYNLHFHNPDAHGVRRMFMDNNSHLVDAMRKAIRNGKR